MVCRNARPALYPVLSFKTRARAFPGAHKSGFTLRSELTSTSSSARSSRSLRFRSFRVWFDSPRMTRPTNCNPREKNKLSFIAAFGSASEGLIGQELSLPTESPGVFTRRGFLTCRRTSTQISFSSRKSTNRRPQVRVDCLCSDLHRQERLRCSVADQPHGCLPFRSGIWRSGDLRRLHIVHGCTNALEAKRAQSSRRKTTHRTLQ